MARTVILIFCLFLTELRVNAITIGAGASIGIDKRGTTWFEELQDWKKEDVRALDPNDDEYRFNDAHDPGRDIVAFYSRDGGADGNYYFRVDFFEQLFNAQLGNVDVYVAIDCALGGRGFMPDNIETNTQYPWELVVKLYQHDGAVLEDKNGADVTSGNWLGSYWRSDLDGVEFGIKRQALLNAGWDGSSTLYFQVYTVRDNTSGPGEIANGSDVVDYIGTLVRNENNSGFGLLVGAIPSNSTTGRAKYAAIAHANQSVATRTGTQGHIYTNRSDINLHPGFIRTVDTHQMLKAPLNMHLSGSLISSLLWARQDPAQPGFPERDGPTFLNSLKNLIANGSGSLIGGVYAEHIMPYFEGAVNQASIKAFNDLAQTTFGLTAADMKVMHVPERVMHANTGWAHANANGPLKGQPMLDITAGGYAATYLDEVTHLHWWFYPNEQNNPSWTFDACGAYKWAGFGGTNDEPYHHKLHKINGVLTFMINDREDNAKFGNADGGMSLDTRYTLLNKALSPDYAQITIVFDDWEAFAGNSFASSTPNSNADQWHNTVRWAANHPWIEIVHLKDVVAWAQADASWVVDHGSDVDGKTLQNYEWLKRASEHSYDNWYYGSGQEQDFFNRVPPTAPSGFTINGTKKYGDMNTPGTLLRDSWDKVAAMPAGRLRTLAEWTYSAMVYETAWHDEDANPDQYQSRNYQVTFNRQDACTTSYEDTTFDNTSGWALRLHGHARKVGIHADAAQWVQDIQSGTQAAATIAQAKDVDDDLWDEYILKNNRVYLCFKRWGARLIYAFVYNADTQQADQVIGVPVANPAEEHDGEGADNNRVSALKDRFASTGDAFRFIDMDYALTAPTQGANYFEFVSASGEVRKRVSLPRGRDTVRADYSLSGVGSLYIRNGLGPNQLDLLQHGDAHLTTHADAFSYGLTNSAGGAAFVVRGTNSARTTGALPNAGYQNRELPLVEQVEVFNANAAAEFSFYLAFSQPSANDIDGDELTNSEEQMLGSDYTKLDTDGNGMSDGFEHQYFGTVTGNDPNGDADGDGRSNVAEYIAGTSPTNASSRFEVTNVQRAANTFTIAWRAVPGRSYRVHASEHPNSGFTPVSGPLTASTTTMQFMASSGAPRGFYQVEVLPEL